jgi:hypothetical protein
LGRKPSFDDAFLSVPTADALNHHGSGGQIWKRLPYNMRGGAEMKKNSSFAWGLLWAGVMVFFIVQFVSAEVIGGPDEIQGSITAMTGDGLVIDTEEDETVKVYGMGPASHWAEEGVALPKVGDEVLIEVYLMTEDKYVAASIDNSTQDTFIELRVLVYDSDDDMHLIPLWSQSKNLPGAVTTVFSTNAVDCDCDCKCYCQGVNCDCACDCEDCLENQYQYQKSKGGN